MRATAVPSAAAAAASAAAAAAASTSASWRGGGGARSASGGGKGVGGRGGDAAQSLPALSFGWSGYQTVRPFSQKCAVYPCIFMMGGIHGLNGGDSH